jgi:pSer/pThr/pTyr-binding forkhead associated (FHA) protein
MEAKLHVLNGKHKDREIPLPHAIFLLGRDVKCHLRLHSTKVSRRHCAIAVNAGKVSVRDLKSVNGTFINDKRISGEVRVVDGDRLQVGPLVFHFCIKNAANDETAEQRITPGSFRWLLENLREGSSKRLEESTESIVLPELLGSSSEPGEPDPASGVFSPGEFFFKSISKSLKNGTKPALHQATAINKIAPAAEADTND